MMTRAPGLGDSGDSDQARARDIFAERDRAPGRGYGFLLPETLIWREERERCLHAVLNRFLPELTGRSVLDFGCGTGLGLVAWIGRGVAAADVVGVDVSPARLAVARGRLPSATRLELLQTTQLPFEDAAFDIVTQETVFTSILDTTTRQTAARELARVLRPGGLLLWYDFWVNPGNADTRAIRLREVGELFPDLRVVHRARITLAPPIARLLAPRSMSAARLVAHLPLRTHWHIAMQRP